MPDRQFDNYEDFFRFYLTQHSQPANRILHACGTVLGTSVLVGAIATRKPWWIIAAPVVGYAFAWIGHFGVEGNKPATFGHPLWSFISDYRMFWMMVTGKLEQEQSSTHPNPK